MVRNGRYSARMATLIATTRADIKLDGGRLDGVTANGATFVGSYEFIATRNLVRFTFDCTMPAWYRAVTGYFTEAAARTVRVAGECPPGEFTSRFSIDFAGRAIDILMTYEGPLDGVSAVA